MILFDIVMYDYLFFVGVLISTVVMVTILWDRKVAKKAKKKMHLPMPKDVLDKALAGKMGSAEINIKIPEGSEFDIEGTEYVMDEFIMKAHSKTLDRGEIFGRKKALTLEEKKQQEEEIRLLDEGSYAERKRREAEARRKTDEEIKRIENRKDLGDS